MQVRRGISADYFEQVIANAFSLLPRSSAVRSHSRTAIRPHTIAGLKRPHGCRKILIKITEQEI
jgi:hypothetical protein